MRQGVLLQQKRITKTKNKYAHHLCEVLHMKRLSAFQDLFLENPKSKIIIYQKCGNKHDSFDVELHMQHRARQPEPLSWGENARLSNKTFMTVIILDDTRAKIRSFKRITHMHHKNEIVHREIIILCKNRILASTHCVASRILNQS